MASVPPRLIGRLIQRFPDYWDHPHPYGLVAAVKGLLNGITGAVDSAAIVAGPPPSTEEDAFRYNQAHDLGPGAAFEAVTALAPGVPKGTGGLLARGFAEAARSEVPRLASSATKPSGGLAGRLAEYPAEQGVPRSTERLGRTPIEGATREEREQVGELPTWDPSKPFALPDGSSSSQPPPNGYGEAPSYSNTTPRTPNWNPGRPFTLDTAQPPEWPPFVKDDGIPPQTANDDPDFRQLSRVPPDSATTLDATSVPEWAARQGKVSPASKPSESAIDPEPGGGGASNNDDECGRRYQLEKDRCDERKDEYNYDKCVDRAHVRKVLCDENGGRPRSGEPPEWGPADEKALGSLRQLTPLEQLPEGSDVGPGKNKPMPRSFGKEGPLPPRCKYCGDLTTWGPSSKQFHRDHNLPKSRGGDNSSENYIPSCRECNLDKKDLNPEEWYRDRERRWDESHE